MATIFVGPASAGAADGTSWANRYGTLNAAEDRPVAAGDQVIVGPGVYRELLTVDVSGGTPYATGTVTVTNGSAVVTGSGTTWSSNAFADGQFGVFVAASGSDGVTDGSATFTSAAGNFQAAMIGMTIRIATKGAYLISAVGSATSITLVEVDGGTPAPSAGTGLTYNVGPTDAIEILSVDSNTQITLKRAWSQPTLTGVAYQVWRDIKYIADVSGHLTDGIGGPVRITGSDNDTTATRASCITATSKNGRTFRGFCFDMTTAIPVTLITACSNWVIEDCYFAPVGANTNTLSLAGTGVNNTIRRSTFMAGRAAVLIFTHSSTLDDCGTLVEACVFTGNANSQGIRSDRVGGITIRDCLLLACNGAIRVQTALTTGQTVTVRNNLIVGAITALTAATAPATNEEITESYNTLYSNATDRSNVSAATSSNAYPPLFEMPKMLAGFQYAWNPFALSQYSPVRAIAGLGQSGLDFYGVPRPVTAAKRSRGPIQFADVSRETTTVRTGAAGLKLADAGRQQMIVPVTAVSTTISCYVQWEADYAGTKPQLIVKQDGQADLVDTATGSSGSWELLSITFTPAASPPYVIVELVSGNSASSTNFDVFVDDLAVT